jgi:type I restriction-modification system DNA methylase subunit
MSHYCDISTHYDFIKSRLKILQEDLLLSEDRNGQLALLMKDLLSTRIFNTSGKPAQVLSELKAILNEWDIINNGDLAGYIYQTLESRSEQKNKGQFFTPKSIVDFIIDNTLSENTNLTTLRVLDPACGSGQFLISLFKKLIDLYEKKGIPFHEAAYLIATRNVYGADIDETAALIARYNISRLSGVPADRLTHIRYTNYLTVESLFVESDFTEDRFDIILGNPPWGSSLSADEKKYYRKIFESAQSGVNTFTLFMERSIQLLKEDGVLGFIIPEAYLNIKAHQRSRLLFLNSVKIDTLTIWGEQFKKVFAPCVSIIAQRCSSEKERNCNIIKIREHAQLQDGTSTLIPQKYYYSTFQNIFNVHYTQKAVSLINRIDDSENIYLENNARFFLGIVTGDNNIHLAEKQTPSHPHPIIIGKDIEQFKINFSGHHFQYSQENLQQVAPQHIYTSPKKIMYKFIGKKLTFAIDYAGYYSLNNVNGFIPEIDTCTPEYLTALLNSSVMQYYYYKTFFTLKVLKGNLERLPLKTCSSSDMTRITDITYAIAHSTSDSEVSRSKAVINDMFLSIYKIRDKDANRMIEAGQMELF